MLTAVLTASTALLTLLTVLAVFTELPALMMAPSTERDCVDCGRLCFMMPWYLLLLLLLLCWLRVAECADCADCTNCANCANCVWLCWPCWWLYCWADDCVTMLALLTVLLTVLTVVVYCCPFWLCSLFLNMLHFMCLLWMLRLLWVYWVHNAYCAITFSMFFIMWIVALWIVLLCCFVVLGCVFCTDWVHCSFLVVFENEYELGQRQYIYLNATGCLDLRLKSKNSRSQCLLAFN